MSTTSPLEALETAIVTSSKLWHLSRSDAWIYGIICGWGDDLPIIAKEFDWDEDAQKKLQELHKAFFALQRDTNPKNFELPNGQEARSPVYAIGVWKAKAQQLELALIKHKQLALLALHKGGTKNVLKSILGNYEDTLSDEDRKRLGLEPKPKPEDTEKTNET